MSDDSDVRALYDAGERVHDVFGALLESHRGRLERMIALRMDRRLQGRIDASDVLQETTVDALRRLPAYLDNPRMPFLLWLRFLTRQKLIELHRRHLGVQARDPRREVSLTARPSVQASSVMLAAHLVGHFTSPSNAVIRAEMRATLEGALEVMDPIDREIIALRHFEQLTLSQAAKELEIAHTAACNRYVRAIRRLKKILDETAG